MFTSRRRWTAASAALVTLLGAGGCGSAVSTDQEATVAAAPTVRKYFIAADRVEWDYAPAKTNVITGEEFGDDENVFVGSDKDRVGSTYLKSIYREYTDESFGELKPRPAEWEHLGQLGPVIQAEVGDEIEVVFKNNTPFPATVHPHGVLYNKDSEGALYADGTSGADQADDSVADGATHVYRWRVPERAGPGPHDPSSVMWMYHSHVDEVADVYAGLMGPIIITRAGEADPDGSPAGVDRQFVVNFMVDDENSSPWLDENVKKFAEEPESVDPDDEDFVESNLMHGINGFVYGSLPGLTTKQGEKVRWYLMGMGTEVDLHTPHWHGNVVTAMGMRTDVVSLLPASMMVADMTPDSPGKWLFHCHVADHISAGMQALFTVE
jgi:hephaestin